MTYILNGQKLKTIEMGKKSWSQRWITKISWMITNVIKKADGIYVTGRVKRVSQTKSGSAYLTEMGSCKFLLIWTKKVVLLNFNENRFHREYFPFKIQMFH